MSNLTDQQKLSLSSAGFTDREISLYRQKFYNLLNTQPAIGFDAMRNLEGFRAQRDELLDALKKVVESWEKGADVFGGIVLARETIAKFSIEQQINGDSNEQ